MLISEYSLMPTGAPQPRTITFDIILPASAYLALTSSGVVDESEAAWCHQGLRVSIGEMGVSVKMGVGYGPCRCGSDQLTHCFISEPGGSEASSSAVFCSPWVSIIMNMYNNWTASVQNHFLTVNTALGESLPHSSVWWVFCPLEAECLRKWLIKSSVFLRV